MQAGLTDNFALLTKDTGREVALKKGLCRKLTNNSNFVQHHAYMVWKEALQTDNVKIEKQEGHVRLNLVNLINLEQKDRNRKVREAIQKFREIQSQKNTQASHKAK